MNLTNETRRLDFSGFKYSPLLSPPCEETLFYLFRRKKMELQGDNLKGWMDSFIAQFDLNQLTNDFVDHCAFKKELTFLGEIILSIYNVAIPIYLALGAFGNFLVILFFLHMNRRKLSKMSSYHFIILNLAIADLLVCVLIPIILSKPFKDFLKFECLFFFDFSNWVCPIASCWLLVLLAFARYRLIVKPFQRKLTKKRCAVLILIIWVLSFCCVSYPFSRREYSDSDGCISRRDDTGLLIFRGFFYVLDFIIPSSLMTYFYNKIEKKLTENELSSINEVSQRRNRKALNTIKYLPVIFVVCVCPGRFFVRLSELLQLFIRREKMVGFFVYIYYLDLVRPMFLLLAYTNNIVNVFVYMKMFPDFRRFLLRIFTFGRCGRESS